MNAAIGHYVWSKSGRDKNTLMVIVGIIDSSYVWVADGKHRSVDKPKKKKVKHLKVLHAVANEVSQAATLKRKLSDADLRKAIVRYLNELTIQEDGGEVNQIV